MTDKYTIELNNVSIINNSVSWGGSGIYCFDVNLLITNVNICNNLSDEIEFGGGIVGGDSSTIIVNSILWNNSPSQVDEPSVNIFYSNVMGGWPGTGNIDADPMFVNLAGGNFNLRNGSPCIDAGTALFEFEGKTIIDLEPGEYKGSAPDMGAIGFTLTTDIEETDDVVKVYTLNQNFPNPFNPVTTISYQIPAISDVDLSIYNLIGQKVATLVSEKQSAGVYKIMWDATGFASGLYFYRLETNTGFVQSKRLVLLK